MSDKVEYAPASRHGPLEALFDGVWVVRGDVRLPMPIKMLMTRSMTVVRADDGSLVLFNTMRLSDDGLQALDALGPVKTVVRLAGFHGRDDMFYKDHYGAEVLAIEGQRYFRGFDPKKSSGNYFEPDRWLTDGADLPISDATLKVTPSRPPEGFCLLARAGGVLIAGDALQNMSPPDEYFNFMAKFMMRLMGFFKPGNVGPGWLKAARPTAADLRAILDWPFENVIPVHGHPVIGGGKAAFRAAIEKAAAKAS